MAKDINPTWTESESAMLDLIRSREDDRQRLHALAVVFLTYGMVLKRRPGLSHDGEFMLAVAKELEKLP